MAQEGLIWPRTHRCKAHVLLNSAVTRLDRRFPDLPDCARGVIATAQTHSCIGSRSKRR
jgi:hypothetical protein